MEVPCECSKCKKRFNLKIDNSEGEKEINQYLTERFGHSGTILCNNCGKKISEKEFYCKECKQKELKKFERNKKATEKRRDESAIRNYGKWAKSGYRTY